MAENKGNPYHDKDGKFTYKSGAKSPEIEEIEKANDNFSSALEKMGFKSKEKEKPYNNLEDAINYEIANYEKQKERFGWYDTNTEMAGFIANEIQKKFGKINGLEEKILERLDAKSDDDYSKKIQKTLGIKEPTSNDWGPEYDETIPLDTHIEVTLPDGGSELVFIEDLEDKLIKYLSEEMDLTEEQKEFISRNSEMPKFLNPFKTDKDFQNDFEEWLRDRYYSNTIDEPDYYDIARESKY